ncbi:MAG: hypothetical protein OEY64_09105 [Nitrospinota bacterium]|nr:hypothetical protein [Nitrospinota bacterium]
MFKKLMNLLVAGAFLASLPMLSACNLTPEEQAALIERLNAVEGIEGSANEGATDEEAAAATATEYLRITEHVSVIDPPDELGKPGLGGFGGVLEAATALGADTEYAVAKANQQVYVSDSSDKAFEVANMLLCFMAQLRYQEMTNKGAYIASVDNAACESKDNKDQGQGGGGDQQQQGSQGGTEYERWVVVSYRKDNTSPQNVRFWIEDDGKGGGGGNIEARLVIDESYEKGKNPFGIFNLNFIQKDDSGNVGMSGYLRAIRNANGTLELQYVMQGEGGGDQTDSQGNVCGSGYMDQAGTLLRNVDTSKNLTGNGQGKARMEMTFTIPSTASTECLQRMGRDGTPATAGSSMSEGGALDLAFNTTHFKRKMSSLTGASAGEVCLERGTANMTESAWRYALFHTEAPPTGKTAGAAVQVRSGFPIVWQDSAGNDVHGHVGYWGMWDPNQGTDEALQHGDKVNKEVFGDSTAATTDFTVFQGGGKLMKHTKKSYTLDGLKDVKLNWSQCNDMGCNNYVVKWTGTKLVKVATIDYNNNGQPTPIDPPVEVVFGLNDWEFNFWAESLNGNGRIPLKKDDGAGGMTNITLAGTTVVTFDVAVMVEPGQTVPATLACFTDCPDPAKIAAAGDNQAKSFTASTWNDADNFEKRLNGTWNADWTVFTPGATLADLKGAATAGNIGNATGLYIAYKWDGTNYMLQTNDAGTGAATLKDITIPTGGDWNSFWSGPMFDPIDANLNQLACDWEATQVCTHKVWELSEYYTWETGADNWSKFSGLKKADGTFAKFEPPIKVEYTHVASTGEQKYVLEYSGFGELHGIPGICVDMDKGGEVDCWSANGDGGDIRWVPAFTIPDGAVVKNAATAAQYYALALEKEKRLSAAASTTDCSGITIATTLGVPTLDAFVDPTVGPMPDITGLVPEVIGGVLASELGTTP